MSAKSMLFTSWCIVDRSQRWLTPLMADQLDWVSDFGMGRTIGSC